MPPPPQPQQQPQIRGDDAGPAPAGRLRRAWDRLKHEASPVLFGSRLCLLLLPLPLALAAAPAGWPAGVVFLLTLLPLCSLAEVSESKARVLGVHASLRCYALHLRAPRILRSCLSDPSSPRTPSPNPTQRLGFVTEQLAAHTSDAIGGLLNATFGNATEAIIAGFAIARGSLRVVKLTLLGSIVSNLLLVLGSSFVVGAWARPLQHFNVRGAGATCVLLILVGALHFCISASAHALPAVVVGGKTRMCTATRREGS